MPKLAAAVLLSVRSTTATTVNAVLHLAAAALIPAVRWLRQWRKSLTVFAIRWLPQDCGSQRSQNCYAYTKILGGSPI
ncbi:MAG: hypothetical protein KME49_27170 [Brasilonema octagenarum HA4186-MV1]|nr:hypothetical protein [Brasilonema octagenarum HA4186-MV1]